MRILNLTQHKLTIEQEIAGVYTKQHQAIKLALTFNEMPTKATIEDKVQELVHIVDSERYTYAQMMGQHAFESLEECGLSHEECCEKAHQTFANTLDMPFRAMIGGAPYLMGPLESALKAEGIIPMYAYSERVGEEFSKPDGSVEKRFVFKHLGFYEA